MLNNPLQDRSLEDFLRNDDKVKVAVIDTDGQLRGKILSKEKFLAVVHKGFGFSSATFGWDMHDEMYRTEAKVAPSETGFGDFLAIPDLQTLRHIPWEKNIPFCLLDLYTGGRALSASGRSVLKQICNRLAEQNCSALAGVELEFMNFRVPSDKSGSPKANVAAFLKTNAPSQLDFLTEGMFGYSLTRPTLNQDYFSTMYDNCTKFDCPVEGWHTESAPGAFEAALKVANVETMADRVTLFKYVAKSTAVEYGITPCFMAKPVHGLAGNSGHVHISLCNDAGANILAREAEDKDPRWPDIAHLSDLGRHFLAGILVALPDLMPLLAPTINSYKRLVENFWAPVNINWGLEDRFSSIRLIAPPICSPSATRFEIRIPGADFHPHYSLSGILAAGWRGVEKKLALSTPPRTRVPSGTDFDHLPVSLDDAVRRFRASGSIAREIFGDEFVDYYAASRDHELLLWRESVTDWEFRRYIETV